MPSATVSHEAVSPEDMREAKAVRQRYGLPSDPAWINAVAADPRSAAGLREFGIPLLPDELADLMSRSWSHDLLARAWRYGGLFPDEFAGARSNLEASGVVAYFTDRVDRHSAALEVLAGDDGPIVVRQVTWSLVELEAFVEQVDAEAVWFESIGVSFNANNYGGENFVLVEYEGDEAAGPEILAHFGNPAWLQTEWQGPLAWDGPVGGLRIEVTDPEGQPLPGLQCDPESLDPGYIFDSALIYHTDDAGVCAFENIPAVEYLIHVRPSVPEGGLQEAVMTVGVSVAPDDTTTARVLIPAS